MRNGRIIYILVIASVFFYLIFSMTRFDEGSAARQAESVRQIVDKALVTCYALEGSYPADIGRVERYGVILDHTRFIYHYEWFGGNLKPYIVVLAK